MKSATEVSTARRPAWALQVSVYRPGPCCHRSAWPSSITSGMAGPRVQEGSALQPTQGINYQALPYTWAARRAGLMLGRWPEQPAESHEAPAVPRECGSQSGLLFLLLHCWLRELARSQNSTWVLRQGGTFTVGNWNKNKRDGQKSAPGHPFLSECHLPFFPRLHLSPAI